VRSGKDYGGEYTSVQIFDELLDDFDNEALPSFNYDSDEDDDPEVEDYRSSSSASPNRKTTTSSSTKSNNQYSMVEMATSSDRWDNDDSKISWSEVNG